MRNGFKAWAFAVVMIAGALCLINAFPLDADPVAVYTDTYEDDDISVSYTDDNELGMGLFDIEFLETVPTNPVRISIDGGSLTSPLLLEEKKLYYATDPKLSTGQHTVTITGGNLYAKQFTITLVKYTVSFSMQGHGSQVVQQQVDHNGKAIKPADPTAAGFAFGGWYKEAACTTAWNFDDPVTENATLYAKWTEYQVTVKFNANQGTGTMTDQIIKYSDSSKALKANTFNRSNYTFSGWATTSTGAVSYADKAAIPLTVISSTTATLQLYAVWTGGSSPDPGPSPSPGPSPGVTKYTVTFTATTGGKVSPTSVSVNSWSMISTEKNVMKIGTSTITATADKGYTFDKWSVTSGTVTANMSITAQFKVAEPDPVTKEVTNGLVTLPSSVVKALKITEPNKLVLTIEKVRPTLSNIPSDAVCFNITLKYDGTPLTSFTSPIDLLLKYTPPTGKDVNKLKVYYVSDDGKKVEDMKGSYDSTKNGMNFGSTHLSVFVITDGGIEPIAPTLTSITVKTAPTKVSYTEGDNFDPTGLVLNLRYDDGSSAAMNYKGNESKFSFDPSLSTSLKTTDTSVTITYEGKSTTQTIIVNTPQPAPPAGGDNMPLFIIGIVVIAILAVGIFYFVRKKGSP